VGGSSAYEQILQHPDPQPALAEEEDVDSAGLLRRAGELIQTDFQPRTWQAFWRTVIEGQPTEAAADALGMTSKAVRQARLREEFGELLEGESLPC
jgi:RNA polymerase sigma-70 factor (ECF subfamily)